MASGANRWVHSWHQFPSLRFAWSLAASFSQGVLDSWFVFSFVSPSALGLWTLCHPVLLLSWVYVKRRHFICTHSFEAPSQAEDMSLRVGDGSRLSHPVYQGGGIPAILAIFFHPQTSQDGTFGKRGSGRRRKNFHYHSEIIPVNILV